MSTVTHPLSRVAVASAALLLLSGCTPGTPTPTASPTVEASSTPSPPPTVEPMSAPEPRIGLTCDELGAALPLATTFSVPVSSVSRAATEYGAHPSMPEEYVVRSLGGLVCEFSNGEPQSVVRGTSSSYVGVRLLVLPDAVAGWERYVDLYDVVGTREVYCSAAGGGSSCTLNALAGTAWVDAEVVGAVTDAAATAVVDSMLAAVSDAGPGAEPWSPPADTIALPTECSEFIDAAGVMAATGLAGPFDVRGRDGGGWSLRGAAITTDDSPKCMIAFEFADAGIGTISTLLGGQWAAAEAQAIVGLTPLTVAGLGADDEAWLRCGPADAWCVIDLVLGGNWVEVYLWEDDPGAPLERRAAIQEIAATIVANVVS
jgi:hypothetical protein